MKSRLPLLLILLIAIAAPLAATALFYLWRPDAYTFSGEMLPPSAPPPLAAVGGAAFAADDWRGGWTLAQLAPAACAAACRRRLCMMRQLRLMVNPRRIRRVWFVSGEDAPPSSIIAAADCGFGGDSKIRAQAVEVAAGVVFLRADAAARRWLAGEKNRGNDEKKNDEKNGGGAIFVIDPRGRLMMRFGDGVGIYNMRDDLIRLLKYR